MKLAALQREQFVKARDYQQKWAAYRKAAAAGETTKGYVGIGLGSLAFIASVIACLLGA